MEKFASAKNLAKNLAKTRDWLSSVLQVVTAPFSRFFTANTLHHRLLAELLSGSRERGVWVLVREMEKTNIPLIDPLCRPYFESV